MLDIRFIRENPEIVRENIRKKFQDAKLPLVDEVIELDAKNYLDAINAALLYWEDLSPDEKKKRSQLYIAHMTRRDAWKAQTRNADFTYFIIRK